MGWRLTGREQWYRQIGVSMASKKAETWVQSYQRQGYRNEPGGPSPATPRT